MIRDEELTELFQVIDQIYGYDFNGYAKASLKRRVNRLMIIDSIPSFAELIYRIKTDRNYFEHMVEELSVNVTEMFRDPHLYKKLREILPSLAVKPVIRIWHAGCATGEEVYSLAILLEELGLLKKSMLYATDINPTAIQHIPDGIFPLSKMKQYSENYIQSGGKEDFSGYYTAQYELVKFHERFSKKIIVSTHNLVSDRSFNEFQMIFCRNVLIYFDKPLQDKVLQLFDDSLEKLGLLVLGTKENIRFSSIYQKYVQIDKTEKIWRKQL